MLAAELRPLDHSLGDAIENIVLVETEDGWATRDYHVDGDRRWFTCENPEADEQAEPLPDTTVYRVTEHRERP